MNARQEEMEDEQEHKERSRRLKTAREDQGLSKCKASEAHEVENSLPLLAITQQPALAALVSPPHPLTCLIPTPLTRRRHTLSPATALASMVLPVPGGPTSNTPQGGRAPSF